MPTPTTPAPIFGTDLNCYPDLDFTVVSDPATVLGQALWRRLTTLRGALFYDLDYGRDIREMLNDALDDAAVATWQSQIAAECQQDERVKSATCTIALSGSPMATTATVTINVQTAAGPFVLVLQVNRLSVSILSAQLG